MKSSKYNKSYKIEKYPLKNIVSNNSAALMCDCNICTRVTQGRYSYVNYLDNSKCLKYKTRFNPSEQPRPRPNGFDIPKVIQPFKPYANNKPLNQGFTPYVNNKPLSPSITPVKIEDNVNNINEIIKNNKKYKIIIGASAVFLIAIIIIITSTLLAINSSNPGPNPGPTPIPGDKFDFSQLGIDDELIKQAGIKTWDTENETGDVYFPLEWDPQYGSIVNDDNLSWMFNEEAAANFILPLIVEDILASDNNKNGDFDNISVHDIALSWNYNTTAGQFTETISASDTDNAQQLLTGSYQFIIYNYPPIDISNFGDNGVLTIPGNKVFTPGQCPSAESPNLDIYASRKLTDAINDYFTQNNFFEDQNLKMYQNYFNQTNQDPKGTYFVTQYKINKEGFYNELPNTECLIEIPMAENGDQLNEWVSDVPNKTFSIDVNTNKEKYSDPTVIGTLKVVCSWEGIGL
ncbi:hypothetical protein [Spiroplasma endosymbiont of Amphibalanus improvisus]|uniref:hypothetical protein n=1 Tax=Spiroplasma endosymbiont of Amphibalanus improvisus TaxID=3066327 RepID=UPI00313B3B88